MSLAATKVARWKKDPVLFVRECFGVEPDAWQHEVLSLFPQKQRMAMLACKGPGKTATLAWLAWNFLATRPHPKVIATSISGDNLADGLFSEMAKWQNKSPLLMSAFTWNQESIKCKDHQATWFMAARQWSKSANSTQQANTLAGKHADYMLFILDEAGGIPDAVMAAAEAALASGIETKLLIAGNPTHLEGPLYRAATSEKHLWHVTEITADPNDPKRTPRVSVQWAKEQIEKYGADSPWVLVNVFGRFPPSSLNTLLGPNEVGDAMKRNPLTDYNPSQKRIGIDVSRFGDDRTVLFPRQGLIAYEPVIMRNARTNEIAARVALAKAKWGSEMEFVDDTGGYGAGVVDSLIQAGHAPLGINFSGKATDGRFFNKRSEIIFLMAEWVKRGGCLPNIPELVQELTAPTYTLQNGKFRVEEKDLIKQRIGRSPDLSDALALTFSLPEMPASLHLIHPSFAQPKIQTDFDPLRD